MVHYVLPALKHWNSALRPQSVFACFVFFSKQTAIISLNGINRLTYAVETYMFPVRYEVNIYILFRRNSVFSQSRSYVTTDGQSASLSWCQAASGAYDQILVTIRQLRVCLCGTPSLTTGRVCRLQRRESWGFSEPSDSKILSLVPWYSEQTITVLARASSNLTISKSVFKGLNLVYASHSMMVTWSGVKLRKTETI
jgi:hypothetical protein